MGLKLPFGYEISKATKEETGVTEMPGDKDLIKRAYELFNEFRNAYAAEWSRLDRNDRFYLGNSWAEIPVLNAKEPRPTTPVLFSTIENIKADLMDRVPEAVILPEGKEDEPIAEVVNALIKQNHDAFNYAREHERLTHDLCVCGYCVQEVGYDVDANNGVGGAFIRHTDPKNIMFDPQVSDVQSCRAIFKYETRTVEWMKQTYPEASAGFAPDEYSQSTATNDDVMNIPKSLCALLIEMWWKEPVEDADPGMPRWRVHMAKIANRMLLEDSRIEKPEGYFASGEYPFAVTPLFRRRSSMLGYGLVDIFYKQQMFADKLDQITMKNAVMSAKNKLLITEASGFDPEDLRDWSKEVHRGESLSGITWFSTPPLPEYVIGLAEQIRNGIKEESGANEFSRGNVAAGVTSASAIESLQEVSSKRSRMIARIMHEAFKTCVRMEIAAEYEFNFLPRTVRITKDGEQRTETFESAMMERVGEDGIKLPIEFYVSIKIESETRYAKQAQNDFIIRLFEAGILTPDQAIELMNFEGKESVLGRMQKAGAARTLPIRRRQSCTRSPPS